MRARFALILLLLLVCSCSGGKSTVADAPDLPRPTPGYMHWMQQQSMLAKAPDLIAEVSQSQRVWLLSGEAGRADVMLKAAPDWLQFQGAPDKAKAPYFRQIADGIGLAAQLGFGGIYLGQTGEKADIWVSRDGRSRSQKPVGFAFDSAYGSEKDFERLAQEADAAGLQLGSGLLPGATGLGPDFFLQARRAAEHSGLYAMLPAPESVTELLPLAREEWDGIPISATLLADLAKSGALPAETGRDGLPWASKGGWAVTGPVLGADGQVRRWFYRYSENPGHPVLSWQDPSGQAAKVLTAAIIRQTGLLGQSLTGLSFEPMFALEPGKYVSLSPGLDALNETSRQIHRYGGWALQVDPLPIAAVEAVLKGQCDFCRDDITALLVMFGLLNADGRALAQLYRDFIAKGLDVSRLARGFDAEQGLKVALLLDNPEWTMQAVSLSALGPNASLPGLAKSIFPDGLTDSHASMLYKFEMSWRLGLPGLAFVEYDGLPGIGLADDWLKATLAARKASGVAWGKIISVTRGRGGGFGLLTQLPENRGFWLLACNFGRMSDDLHIDLPASIAQAKDAGSGASLDANLHGRSFRIGLDGREALNVLLLTRP